MIDSDFKTAKILIVDDKQANVDVLHEFLEIQGYQNIKTTTDPRDVKGLMTEFKPDLILLDLKMPHLSGFDVMKQLKPFISASTYLPILVLTVDIAMETKRKALQSGASDFLTKPFDLIELQARVNTHLQIRFKTELINNYALQLEKLIATKDVFFSIIAHDLRNPFVGIENYVKIILKYGEYNPDEIEDQLKTIYSTALRGRELLENLLTWARSQTDRIEINPELFNLNEAVNNCYNLVRSQAENKDIELINEVGEAVLIDSDQDALETVLRNLISNAVKYTKSGTIKIGAVRDEESIEVSVSDTGIGIEANQLKNLFEIDKNLNSRKGTHGEKGTGLGLILCKEFIDKLGGTIWAESEVGKGTTIKFRLPDAVV